MGKDLAVIMFVSVVAAATTVVLFKWNTSRTWLLGSADIVGATTPGVVSEPTVTTPEAEPMAILMQ